MAKYSFRKLILTAVSIGILAPTAYFGYEGYQRSISPSGFELAAGRLGFNGYKKAGQAISQAKHQEALLAQLQMAGYFQPSTLWQDINKIGGIKDPVLAFSSIYQAVKKSNADQKDSHKFDAKILRKNLAKGSELDKQDIIDLLLYEAQKAFGRKIGQERNELSSQDWMDKHKEEYFAAATILRLIDRETPQRSNYDGAWIAGASRIGVLARIIDYNNIILKYNITINGETSVLAGARELWANIDGITPIVRDRLVEAYKAKIDLDTLDISLPVGEDAARIEEGKEYMANLAEHSGIKLNQLSPFIQCATKEECEPGRFPGRVYPNYAEAGSAKLTETLMSQDLIATYPTINIKPITIVDTLSEQSQRPNTSSTARDAAERIIKRIANVEYSDKQEFIILLETNNPYIERQTIATQREVNKMLEKYGLDKKGYKIQIEGVGFKCKQDVATVHSESAALIAEKWKTATAAMQEQENLPPKRAIETLLYQTRDNSIVDIPQPEIQTEKSIVRLFQDLFDYWLE